MSEEIKNSEVLKLFMLIQNAYNAFTFDQFKAEVWRRTLVKAGVTYEIAEQNLYAYTSNPDNTYPPHPGALARRNDSVGSIPNADETRAMIAEYYDTPRQALPPCVAELKARLQSNAPIGD